MSKYFGPNRFSKRTFLVSFLAAGIVWVVTHMPWDDPIDDTIVYTAMVLFFFVILIAVSVSAKIKVNY